MTKEKIEFYWEKFLAILPHDSPYHSKTYIAQSWGDSPEMADELGDLIVRDIKTATCEALWQWGDQPVPETGQITVVLNGHGEPICIIEATEVTIRKYNEVDSDFAQAEGEGDFSLDYWRDAHKNYFSRTLPKIGKEFSEDMPLVCERFKVIYK